MPRLLSSIAVVLAALVLPAQAGAALVFQRGDANAQVWIANDDGSGAHRLTAGSNPTISPDGQTVAFVRGDDRQQLLAMPAAGGAARVLVKNWTYGARAWSPDSRTIATTTGPLNGWQRLVVVDVATGAVRTIARGYFQGASFSPQSDQVVYDRATRQTAFPKSDLWIAPVAVGNGAPRRLTTDGHATSPVWGPTQIAYSGWKRPTGKYRKIDGPKHNLWLISPDGANRRQLTHDRVPYLLAGLFPTAWSADGTKLLAQYGGQDTSYAVGVDAATGAQHVIGPKGEVGLAATALSQDGSTVLGWMGLMNPTKYARVVTVPFAGGRQTVLARAAAQPDWTR